MNTLVVAFPLYLPSSRTSWRQESFFLERQSLSSRYSSILSSWTTANTILSSNSSLRGLYSFYGAYWQEISTEPSGGAMVKRDKKDRPSSCETLTSFWNDLQHPPISSRPTRITIAITTITTITTTISMLRTFRFAKNCFVLSKLFKQQSGVFQESVRQQAQRMQAEFKPDIDTSKQKPAQHDPNKPISDQEDLAPFDFMERSKEIEGSADFVKLKRQKSGQIPSDVGKGGFDEIVFWSSQVSLPEQILRFVKLINAAVRPEKMEDPARFVQLLEKVTESVYLLHSFEGLSQYALIAFNYGIKQEVFWEKVSEKARRLDPVTPEERDRLINVAFLMSKTGYGLELYNQVEKYFITLDMTLQQVVKCGLMFFQLSIGSKEWLAKIMKELSQKMSQANPELLCEILPALKMAKSVPTELNNAIKSRASEIIGQLSFREIGNLCMYFEQDELAFWDQMEQRMGNLLKQDGKFGRRWDTIETITLCVLPTYKCSTEFVKQHVLSVLKEEQGAKILERLKLKALSGLSKSLYIYELEKEAAELENRIQDLLIQRIMKDINTLNDWELVMVVKDYNVTRHGQRKLYIFFEEVLKLKYLSQYNPHLDRNVLQAFYSIYEASGSCSSEFFSNLRNMLG